MLNSPISGPFYSTKDHLDNIKRKVILGEHTHLWVGLIINALNLDLPIHARSGRVTRVIETVIPQNVLLSLKSCSD